MFSSSNRWMGVALGASVALLASCRDEATDRNGGGQIATPTPPPPPPAPAAKAETSRFLRLRAPAGNQPATRSINIDGFNAAILPNGRLITPVGQEINVDAPKSFGL